MTGTDFLIINTSALSVKEICDRIEKNLQQKKVTIFARINHGQAAKDAGLNMQEEEVLIFGNPQVGTALMLENPAIGIELPLKILVWQQKEKTCVAYQDLDKLAQWFQLKTSLNTIEALKNFITQKVDEIEKPTFDVEIKEDFDAYNNDDSEFEILKADKETFVVTGGKIKRLANVTDARNLEQILRLQNILIASYEYLYKNTSKES